MSQWVGAGAALVFAIVAYELLRRWRPSSSASDIEQRITRQRLENEAQMMGARMHEERESFSAPADDVRPCGLTLSPQEIERRRVGPLVGDLVGLDVKDGEC